MNKKGIIIAIIAIIVIVVIGICIFMTQNKETKQVVAENDVQEQLNNETQNTYEFKDGDKAISLNSNFAELNMPKENNYYEVQSCAFDGMDKIYTYDHYEIRTYPDGETDKVASIYFLDEQVQTQEGVKIGDSFETMVEKYGENYENLDAKYIYTKEKTQINFIITDNAITSIEYTYITD